MAAIDPKNNEQVQSLGIGRQSLQDSASPGGSPGTTVLGGGVQRVVSVFRVVLGWSSGMTYQTTSSCHMAFETYCFVRGVVVPNECPTPQFV